MNIAVVRVLIEDRFIGTAFFINNHTLITAKHVIEKALVQEKKITLDDMPNKGNLTISSKLITGCTHVDIAIIELERNYNITPLIFNNNIEVGSKVTIYGYKNQNGEINQQSKEITGFTNNQDNIFESGGYISKGYSGSPVILDNKLCGITISRSKEENITYIIPISKACIIHDEKKINSSSIKHETNYNAIHNIVDKYKFSIILSRRYINIKNYQKLVASTLLKREDFTVKILEIWDYAEFDIKSEIQIIFNLETNFPIERTLPRKIEKSNKKILLIVKNFESIKEEERERVAKLLRNLTDDGNYPNFYLIIFGGKRLAHLVYGSGKTSLLRNAHDVWLWEEQIHQLSHKIVELTGNHPKLNSLCNQITLNSHEEYKNYLRTHNLNRTIFNGYDEKKLCRYLEEEDLGVYLNSWDRDKFIRSLFWDNLLRIDKGRLIWRSNFIRELGRDLFCDT